MRVIRAISDHDMHARMRAHVHDVRSRACRTASVWRGRPDRIATGECTPPRTPYTEPTDRSTFGDGGAGRGGGSDPDIARRSGR
eukprot:8889465-Pyramimonas_sp.AAC.1